MAVVEPEARVPRRALILAGGGVKVAFQAGVLQVLLDETEGLDFFHVDGASGGTLNLAMLCAGLSGRRIADNWRHFQPIRIIEPNPALLLGESIARLDRLRDVIFPEWGLDFNAIRASAVSASFNVYDFSRHQLQLLTPADMTPELLAACVSLPMWFPPVRRNGDVLIDPVYITDANLDEAIDRGADELWIIWTVSRRAQWHRGFVNHYFQVIETASYGQFKRFLQRIEASNRALAAGEHAPYDRHITVRTLYAEVDVHYLINFRRKPFRRAVDNGVVAGRAWCRENGVRLRTDPPPTERPTQSVLFRERMAGPIAIGEADPERGAERGRREATSLTLHVMIETDDLSAMLSDPRHEARACGWVQSTILGGRLPVDHGTFRLFVPGGAGKEMIYRLFFRDGPGNPLTLTGVKYIPLEHGGNPWADTTTLYVRLLAGHPPPGESAEVVGAGILRLGVLDFAHQLSTFRGTGQGALGGVRAVVRYSAAFVRTLLRVYTRLGG
jgi:predicted acylesterase/phospholipase RssA